MTPNLPQIAASRLSGSEPFTDEGRELGFDVLSFWRWSTSDLLDNATRGIVAEFTVAQALGIAGRSIRQTWDPYDLTTPEGTKIEVKSASYVQSWYQREYSRISFNVRRTLAWDAETNLQSEEAKRHADVMSSVCSPTGTRTRSTRATSLNGGSMSCRPRFWMIGSGASIRSLSSRW